MKAATTGNWTTRSIAAATTNHQTPKKDTKKQTETSSILTSPVQVHSSAAVAEFTISLFDVITRDP